MRMYHSAKTDFPLCPVVYHFICLLCIRYNKVCTGLFDRNQPTHIYLFQIFFASKQKSLFYIGVT